MRKIESYVAAFLSASNVGIVVNPRPKPMKESAAIFTLSVLKIILLSIDDSHVSVGMAKMRTMLTIKKIPASKEGEWKEKSA